MDNSQTSVKMTGAKLGCCHSFGRNKNALHGLTGLGNNEYDGTDSDQHLLFPVMG